MDDISKQVNPKETTPEERRAYNQKFQEDLELKRKLGLKSWEELPDSSEPKTAEEKVKQELDNDEKTKTLKDIGERVAGSKKEKSKYKTLSIQDLDKIEDESERAAFELVNKTRAVPEPYDPEIARDTGSEDAGIAYYKTKLWKSIKNTPANERKYRSAYLTLTQEIADIIAKEKDLSSIITTMKQKFRKASSYSGYKFYDDRFDFDLSANVLGVQFFNIVYGTSEV